ncbi:Chitin synthase regulatory factor 3 [Nosema granulosis]|uniref:Chitin synthase regulatory factor 3 n=1 Tax=Nosema granulosis TaxID=83296 RepID=A0A9P6GY15_9MICR|nr:Chitin synthase regulatory factor 3 [Nosema granulosis]
MNSHYGIFDESLKKKYLCAKASKTPQDMLEFIKIYLICIENESKPGKHIFLTYNPLRINLEKKQFMNDFNSLCLNFLITMATTSKKKKLSSEAQAYLGIAYELGVFGLRPDIKNAFSYYSVSTKLNNKCGTYRLAQFYEKGLVKQKNINNAAYFYRCSAKLGCIFGLHTYGSILMRGALNTPKDFDSGLFYLKLAAQHATEYYPYAFYDLGQIYESSNNVPEVVPDDDYAFKLYKRGALIKCPNSQYRLAKVFENGELFQKRNMRIALEYLYKASKNGHVEAHYALSRYLFTGIDGYLQKDYEAAYMYALKAAARSHGDAAFTVGELIENGCGTEQNKFLALWWYTIATTIGNRKAQSKMNKLSYEVNMNNNRTTHFRMCWCCLRKIN